MYLHVCVVCVAAPPRAFEPVKENKSKADKDMRLARRQKEESIVDEYPDDFEEESGVRTPSTCFLRVRFRTGKHCAVNFKQ